MTWVITDNMVLTSNFFFKRFGDIIVYSAFRNNVSRSFEDIAALTAMTGSIIPRTEDRFLYLTRSSCPAYPWHADIHKHQIKIAGHLPM